MKTRPWLPIVCLVLSTIGHTLASNRTFLILNPGWRFAAAATGIQPQTEDFDDSYWDMISLPHSTRLFSANLQGFEEHGREVGWYRREFNVPASWLQKKLVLELRGAMQTTTLWVNGKPAGTYAVSGYDSFDFDITPLVHCGRNVIAVMVDNRPNPNIPPDGQTMDYVLFGGLYRGVILHVTDELHITFPWEARNAGVRITLPAVSEQQASVEAQTTVRNDGRESRKCVLLTQILDNEGKTVATMRDEHDIGPGAEVTFTQTTEAVREPHLWSPDSPYLYRLVSIVQSGGAEVDRVETRFGIRWVKFDRQEGFFLNGKHLKLVGANRHQTWPFIGNAVPKGLERRDAEQLKAMGVNWVRLSHYPQDPDFLDALDELGLMAVEEPPTWNNLGPPLWKTNLIASFRSMIRRDRNHPCIILWNACINHHPRDRDLRQAAIEEDPTRERGGDTVPLRMDFYPSRISGGGALTIEHTGHTFPAARGSRVTDFHLYTQGRQRSYHTVNREYEQVQHQWEQVNAAYQKPDNCGLALWCMYDYNTSYNTNEPGLVWHGACDLFRIPKYSYYWQQSELTEKPMAYVVRVDASRAAVFSNCEKVRLWQDCGPSGGYREVATQSPDTSFIGIDGNEIPFALHHPPFTFNVATNAVALKAEGLVKGKVSATCEWKQFGAPVALQLTADRKNIIADGADLSRITVTAVDEKGTAVDDCCAEVTFRIQGLGQLIGENPTRLRAGKMIILAQSGYVPGELVISAAANRLRTTTVRISMGPVGPDVDLPKDLRVKQPTERTLASETMARSHDQGNLDLNAPKLSDSAASTHRP